MRPRPCSGRRRDDGMALSGGIVEIFRNHRDRYMTEILVASVRHPGDVIEAARLGADVATMPPKVLQQLVQHPLTDKGLAAFLKDWEATGQKILD
jgi:transaldolase